MALRFLRIPRPKLFLGYFDLQNGAELVLVSALLNKISGIYGILALFTGAAISGLQLSMYIYSIFLGVLLVLISPHVHRRRPLSVISFAYLYLIDSLINALYTILFGISWFLALASKHPATALGSAGRAIDDHTGFTSSEFNASLADALTYPAASLEDGQDAVAIGTAKDINAMHPLLGAGVLQPESATSIFIISVLWAIRVYFVFVVLAYAREVVRSSATPGEAPFTGRNDGEGWKGQLGRTLVGVNKGYWAGEDEWTPMGTKFRRSEEPADRRRRRRDSNAMV
ncbi:hypothetical protein RUND412_009322 [Rhizina undulata]